MLARRLSDPTVHLLTQPVVIAALVVLALNDHLAKQRWGGPVTGLASDVAGLALLPVLLVAGLEIARRRPLAASGVAVVAGVVAASFAAIELLPVAETAWRHSLGALGAPLRWLLAGEWSTAPVAATADPHDLTALPAAALVVALRRTTDPGRRPRSDRPAMVDVASS